MAKIGIISKIYNFKEVEMKGSLLAMLACAVLFLCAPFTAAGLSGYAWEADGTQHVVYVGVDGNIHELWFSQSNGWTKVDVTELTGAPKAVGSVSGYAWEGDGTQHAVYTGTDGNIHELWFRPYGKGYSPEGWTHVDLTKLTNAPIATGSPYGFAWEADGTQHVVYVGVDGNIHELWFSQSNGWTNVDLTKLTGAPAALGTLSGYAWEGDGTQHVVYVGVDGNIHELWFKQSGKWTHEDLTKLTGAPKAVGSASGYAWEGDGTQHVVYAGTDGTIHELWFRPYGKGYSPEGWTHVDLTKLTKAPVATGSPYGFAWKADGTQHVIYVGIGGNIHELWFSQSNGWTHVDITKLTGAPAALGTPSGYAWEGDGTQHVVYTGVGGNVNELWFKQSGKWTHEDLTKLTGAPKAKLS
jgi:hypothetical protein